MLISATLFALNKNYFQSTCKEHLPVQQYVENILEMALRGEGISVITSNSEMFEQ